MSEATGRLPAPYDISLEPWSDEFWSECERLATDHFEEVDGGVESRRPFKVDGRLMTALQDAGALQIVTARKDGRLVGYYTWNVTLDVESEGLVIGQQGAWYVAPGHPKAAFQMFGFSVNHMKSMGVQCIYPHHRTQGRGRALGKFFKRQGAKHIQETYSLWIGA